MSKVWKSEVSLKENLKAVSEAVRDWNRQCSWNTFYKKKRLLARLVGNQKAWETHTTRTLHKLEAKIKES